MGTSFLKTGEKTHMQLQIAGIVSKYGIFVSLIFLVGALSLSSEYFLTTSNIINILRQASINGVLAVGMTFVILSGGIDLSVGSILAASGVVAASLATGHISSGIGLPIIAGIATGVAFGILNGALIVRFDLPPFVVTLGMLSVARGFTLIYSDGTPIAGLKEEFLWIGQGVLLGVPVPVLIFAMVFLASWLVLRHTVFGRYVYAVGGNIRSAKVSGINTRLVAFSVYVIMGAMCGLAALVLTARVTAGLPQAGLSYELDAIAAVVIGGTSLSGGVGSVTYTLIGVLIISVLNNGLDLLGVSSYYQQVIKGLIIVVAVLIDRSRPTST